MNYEFLFSKGSQIFRVLAPNRREANLIAARKFGWTSGNVRAFLRSKHIHRTTATYLGEYPRRCDLDPGPEPEPSKDIAPVNVPEVLPDDLKKVWELGQEVRARNPGGKVAIGFASLLPQIEDIQSVCYRGSMLGMFLHIVGKEVLAPWLKDGQPNEMLLRVAAGIPMKRWTPGVIHHTLPFDMDALMHLLQAGSPG